MKIFSFLIVLINILSAFGSSESHAATVLFIDMNNVDEEIATTRKIVEARGDKLIVLPLDRDSYAQRYGDYLKAQGEMDKLEIELVQNDCAAGSLNSTKCKKIQDKKSDLIFATRNLPQPKMNVETLKSDLKKITDTDIETLMISGHDGGGSFYGVYGNFTADDMLKTLSSAGVLSKVKSLYTLGCRSATEHSNGEIWFAALPNLKVTAGYEQTGFLKTNPNGHKFIADLLKSEKSLLAAESTQSLNELLNRVSPSNPKYSASVCSKLENKIVYMSAKQKPTDLKALLNCDKMSRQLGSAVDFIGCIKAKKSKCPFDSVKEFNLAEVKTCNFQMNKNFTIDLGPKSELYMLDLILNSVELSSRRLFKDVDAKLQNNLGLNKDSATYGEFLEKLKATRDEYHRMASFEKIRNLSALEIDKISMQMGYFDNLWLAYSNFDLEKLSDIYLGREKTARGGLLRAQSFVQDLSGKSNDEKKAAIDSRIGVVSKNKSTYDQSPKRTPTRDELILGSDEGLFLKQELEELQRLRASL